MTRAVAWIIAGVVVLGIGMLTPAEDAPAGVIVAGYLLAGLGGVMTGAGIAMTFRDGRDR